MESPRSRSRDLVVLGGMRTSGQIRAAAGGIALIALTSLVPDAGATGPVVGAAILEAVPTALDSSNQAGWWTPLDELGDDEIIAFNQDVPPTADSPPATEHHVVVGVRSGGGAWRFGCLPGSAVDGGCARFVDDCGHRQPSVRMDGEGNLHVFAGMHNSVWGYYRSEVPGDPATLVDRSAEMPDQGGLITYPVTARTPNGDIYLAARVREVGSPVNGRLYHWDRATHTWSRVAVFASQSYYWVYPDDLEADDAGAVHLIWEWSYGGAGAVRHFGSYLRYEPATGAFTNAQGTPIVMPATTASKVVYQPLAQGETAVGRSSSSAGIQSAKLAIVPGRGTPMIAYRLRPRAGARFEVRRARAAGDRWLREVVYAGTYDTFAALDITHDGEVVRVYYVKKNTRTTDQAHVAEKGRTGGFSERSIAPGRTVERLAVVMDPTGADHLYLADLAEPVRDPDRPIRSEDPACPGPPGVLYTGILSR